MKYASIIRLNASRSLKTALLLAFLTLSAGCFTNNAGMPTALPDRDARLGRSYVFYLDGAGGGTAENNWVGGVKAGFLEAGYNGAGEMVSWNSGEGLVADQTASVAFKRSRATEVARRVQLYQGAQPGTPVHILGFSAGTGEAIYALEALPETVQIDKVVLLGASFSRDYDLTEALKRVSGKLYIFTSERDHMIGLATRIGGTTDREHHDPSVGIKGPVFPDGATAETRRLYAEKIVLIPHTKEMKQDGNKGHHFDNVKKEFIRDYVAPLLMGKPASP